MVKGREGGRVKGEEKRRQEARNALSLSDQA